MTRFAAICIDAAEWPVMQSLMAEGRLPRLAELRRRSAECTIQNVVPYRSELPWTQFLTGRDAKANAYWSTESFDPDTYEPYCRGAYLGDPFWADQPAKVIALDLPHSNLSRRVDGLQVTAWGAHGPQYPRASLPQGLLTEIDERFGPHPAMENDFDLGWFSVRYIEVLTEALKRGAQGRIDAALLMQERLPDWDLMVLSMSEVHSAGHHFWHGVDERHPLHTAPTAELARQRFVDVAAEVDAAIGRLLDALPKDAVAMVFALHGMMPADDLPSMVLLPELFHRLQFGKQLLRTGDADAWRRAGHPFVVPESDKAWAVMTWMRHHFQATPKDRLRAALAGIVPESLYEQARRLAGKPPAYPLGELNEPIPSETTLTPEEIAATGAARKDIEWQPTAWYKRWWPEMPFFALPTFTDAHVRINLKGRESRGIVDFDDYQRTCDQVVDLVRSLRDPRTGKEVVADVLHVRKDDPFDPHGADADLLVIWNTALDAIEHPDVGVVGPVPYMRTGAHTSRGFALFSGEGIARADLGERSAFDLPPTIVDMVGMHRPADMLGSSFADGLRALEVS